MLWNVTGALGLVASRNTIAPVPELQLQSVDPYPS